jgi:hypothetical protein
MVEKAIILAISATSAPVAKSSRRMAPSSVLLSPAKVASYPPAESQRPFGRQCHDVDLAVRPQPDLPACDGLARPLVPDADDLVLACGEELLAIRRECKTIDASHVAAP